MFSGAQEILHSIARAAHGDRLPNLGLVGPPGAIGGGPGKDREGEIARFDIAGLVRLAGFGIG